MKKNDVSGKLIISHLTCANHRQIAYSKLKIRNIMELIDVFLMK